MKQNTSRIVLYNAPLILYSLFKLCFVGEEHGDWTEKTWLNDAVCLSEAVASSKLIMISNVCVHVS